MVINKDWTFIKTSIGPDKWKDKYETCNTSFQSPVNIITNSAVRCEMECKIDFQYFPGKCNVKAVVNQYKDDANTKSTIFLLDYQNGSYVTFNDVTYVLKTIHFYPGGLHTVDNGKYDMEAVLSHTDQSGNILNISVLVLKSTDFGDSQNFFSQWAYHIKNLSKDSTTNKEQYEILMRGDSVTYSVDENWGIDKLLPLNRAFYYYLGSSVHPPCASDVKWLVLKESVDILYNDLLPFITYGNKTFSGSDGELYSEPMRPIQPNPSFVSGQKVERIIYENNNSNNGNIKKEKIYIKCQKVKKSGASGGSGGSGGSSGSDKKFGGNFFDSNIWALIKYITYIVIYVIAVIAAYKAVLHLYSSGKIMSWQSSFTGGTVCMSNDDYMNGYPGNNNTPIAQPITNIDYSSPVNQNITKNSIKSDSQFLKEMLDTGQQMTTISGGSKDLFSTSEISKNINMDIKDISLGKGNIQNFI